MPRVAADFHRDRLDGSALRAFQNHLETVYFRDPPGYLLTREGKADLEHHLVGRLNQDRKDFVPWLQSLLPLAGKRILEVGCGTGSSTVAIAETGASVVGFDIDRPSLSVADERCKLYGLDVELRAENANSLSQADIRGADAVIFFASIEHMTLDEKLNALSNVWDSLRPGKLLIVVETPNRLWWYDYHSALLPFFLWLPDDLAMLYARKSGRAPLNSMFSPSASDDDLTRLARFGRSASFHEFELAIGSLARLRVDSLNVWQRKTLRNKLRWTLKELLFEEFLVRSGPRINRAFFERELNFAVTKPG